MSQVVVPRVPTVPQQPVWKQSPREQSAIVEQEPPETQVFVVTVSQVPSFDLCPAVQRPDAQVPEVQTPPAQTPVLHWLSTVQVPSQFSSTVQVDEHWSFVVQPQRWRQNFGAAPPVEATQR